MEPQESEQATEVDGSRRQMQILETLSPEAKALLETVAGDGYSFTHLLPRKYWEIAGRNIYFPLDADGLSDYVGLDATAPLGAKTPSAVEVSNLVCNLAVERYPDDEKLQYLIAKWAELEEEAGKDSFPRKRPSEIISVMKEFYSVISSWDVADIRRLHMIFAELLASLGEQPETHFIPRYIARIHMREVDGESLGTIQKKGENDIRGGSFVAVSVSTGTCFSRIVFTLGLQPGYHVLAGHGNADDPRSDLYLLRNIRMKLKNDVHRQDRRSFERWGLLYAQTYEDANEIRKLNDADAGDYKNASLQDLWLGSSSSKPAAEIQEIWVTGEELEKILDCPNDPEFRNTVRAFAVRKSSFSDDWEILTVTERGDDPEGRTGKPPLVGLPGGMREDGATLRQTVCRETQNESQTRSVEEIIALVAVQEKKKRSDSERKNKDFWFYVKLDNEAGLSRKMIEGNEIYAVRWLPLPELPNCGFQNTKQKNKTVWDVRKVHDRILLSVNHAANIIRILPRVPGIKIPDNWEVFKQNLRKFQSDNS